MSTSVPTSPPTQVRGSPPEEFSNYIFVACAFGTAVLGIAIFCQARGRGKNGNKVCDKCGVKRILMNI